MNDINLSFYFIEKWFCVKIKLNLSEPLLSVRFSRSVIRFRPLSRGVYNSYEGCISLSRSDFFV
jgi:hypothetical protein